MVVNVFNCFETKIIMLAVVISEIQRESVAGSSFWRWVSLPSWAAMCTRHSPLLAQRSPTGPGTALWRAAPRSV